MTSENNPQELAQFCLNRHVTMGARRVLRVALLAGVGPALLGFSASAHAQGSGEVSENGPTSGIGEIVVTAQRRAESIQNVGIAITALSGDDLAKAGVTSATDIANHVPALQFDSGSGGGVNAFVTIRGVSQVDYSEHQEAPNAVYLDEVYVPTPSMVGFPVYDMARVEALRGPQGTLFGRNSTGGLLQFVTNDPSNDWKGFVNVQYGSYSNARTEAAVGGPIADGVSFRLAGFATVGDGYFKNDVPGAKNNFESNSFGIRGKLKFELGNDWSVLISASLNKSPKHREGVYKSTPTYIDASGVSQYVPANVDIYGTGPGNDPFGYRDKSTSGNEGSFNDVGRLTKQTHYETLKIQGPIGGATLTSITNYTKSKINYFEDSDATPNNLFVFGSGGRTRQVSEELRLSGDAGRLNWTVGGYFLDIKGSYQTEFLVPHDLTILGISAFDAINTYQQHTQSYAAFAQGEYELTDSLKLTIGGRYTHDRKIFNSQVAPGPQDPSYNGTFSPYYDFNATTAAAAGVSNRLSHGDWTGKAELGYQPNRNMLIYASVSRGIRGGGFNATADGSLPYALTPFKNETVLAYEGGAKFGLFDGKVNLRTSAFYYDYSDYQAFNFNGLINTVVNRDAYYYGGEAEIFARPMEGLNLSLGASYLHARVKDITTPLGVMDVAPVKAPAWTVNGTISKTFNVGDYQFGVQYDFNYQSDSKANLVPSPVTTLPASWMQNARISFGRDTQGWEVYGFVKNLADVNRKQFAYDNTSFVGNSIASYAPPRMFGVGFNKKF